MKKMALFIVLMVLMFSGCSQDQLNDFQVNNPSAPYDLLHIFDAYPSLKEAVDRLDTATMNLKLAEMMNTGINMPAFMFLMSDLVEAPVMPEMVGELKEILDIIRDLDPYHYSTSHVKEKGYYDITFVDRNAQFFSVLDQVLEKTDLSGDILAAATQVVDYLNAKDPAVIESDMNDMMKATLYQRCMYGGYAVKLPAGLYTTADLEAQGMTNNDISSVKIPLGMKVTLYDGDNFTGNSLELTSEDRCLVDAAPNFNDVISSVKVEYDVSKMARLLGNLTMACDYPMWLDASGSLVTNRSDITALGTYNTDLGNSAKGIIKLVSGLNIIASRDPQARETIDALILTELPALLNTPGLNEKMKALTQNLSDYFSQEEVDAGGTNYYQTADYHNANPYVNASLKETLRDTLPGIVKLFIRDDNSGVRDNDLRMIVNASGYSPVEALTVSLKKLKDAGIDYGARDTAGNFTYPIEPSLKRMFERNGRGNLRSSDGIWSQVSFLEHLVYTISVAYNFGFLTRVGNSADEPGDNHGYTHGISTKGVMTTNDSLYSMTNRNLLIMGICDLGQNAYSLALSKRRDQGDHIFRSSSSFSWGTRTSHKFYMGYDYPAMLLLPNDCAGDAGIPNGGETAFVPAADTTSGNDWKTYWPRVANGKGILNTAQFLMGWLARASWDGQAPYYYNPEKAGKSVPTASFSWPGKGSRTVDVYYKPNGEVYAYVYKPSRETASTWEFFYPHKGHTGQGDDVSDDPANPTNTNLERSNRYKVAVRTDYFLIQHKAHITMQEHYNAPPMNPNGTHFVEGTTGDAKFKLNPLETNDASGPQQFVLWERIPEKSAVRECASQEEAMVRNYQWFLLEKKFMFAQPMYIDAMGLGWGGAFVVIEANGTVGLANAKKTDFNGKWVFLGSEGIPGTNYNPNYGNNPDYGDSDRPGDGRFLVFSRSISPLGLMTIDFNTIFKDVLGDSSDSSGSVMPDAISRNIEPVNRMAFVQNNADQIHSDDRTATWDDAWNNRNRVFPLLLALTGTLWEGAYYKKAASGYDYNYAEASKHKYPLTDLLEGILIPLSKPLARHYTTDGGRWVPRTKDETGSTFQYFKPNTTASPANINTYIPRDSLRTVLSVLTGSTANSTDGLLPLLVDNTHLLSRVMGLLQNLGSDENVEARTNVALGLEQIMTSMKINKSEAITNGYFKTLDFTPYTWLFSRRAEDTNMEDFLSYEGPFKASHDWTSLDNAITLMKSFIGGNRDITPNVVNIVDAVLAQELTEDQVHGLIYMAGKLFAKNQGGTWTYQGGDHGGEDRYDAVRDMLALMPQMTALLAANGTGANYTLALQNADLLLKDKDDILYYMINTMGTHYSTERVVDDLDAFLGSWVVTSPDSPFWNDLSTMLYSFGEMKAHSIAPEVILPWYGFQRN